MIRTKMLKHCFLLVFVAFSSVQSEETSSLSQREISSSYLDAAMIIITQAKENLPLCDNCQKNILEKAKDCADIQQMRHNGSGVYEIWPVSRLTEEKPLRVYCDMDTNGGGWTVIQRRGNYHSPKDFFFKDWKSYKEGFGDIKKDFWLGNDNIFALTNQKVYSIRFDLKGFKQSERYIFYDMLEFDGETEEQYFEYSDSSGDDGIDNIFPFSSKKSFSKRSITKDLAEQDKKYALYDTFRIDDENNKYTLHISDYSGNAGDAMVALHNNQKFSTKDQENDNQPDEHCAQEYKGGWWYNNCHHSNLNGLYHHGKHKSSGDGINWAPWKGYHESLEWTEIKIRPKSFRLS